MENSLKQDMAVEPGRFRVANLQEESREALQAEILRLRAYVKELEQAADADILAPVYNRRAFLRELVRAQSIFHRHQIPTSLVLLDLDDFKKINARYGHYIGDDVIKQVGQILQETIRDCDLVARLEGDNFGVLLFKADVDEARKKAETFAEAIESIEIEIPSNSFYISASWSVTQIVPAMTPERILASGADALLESKLSG